MNNCKSRVHKTLVPGDSSDEGTSSINRKVLIRFHPIPVKNPSPQGHVLVKFHPWDQMDQQVMQLLIQHGADVKLRDSMGHSAADIISQR